jgi:tetratricopeptide (TPR) repeat protein
MFSCNGYKKFENKFEACVSLLVMLNIPVLMNLSACTLKLGMHRKTHSFCNMAIEIKAGSVNPKVYYRRGRSYMLLGLYKNARDDLHTCLKLLNDAYDSNDNCDSCKSEIDAVNRTLTNLDNLVIAAEKNRKRHEKAMKIVLGGQRNVTEIQENSGTDETNVNNDVNDKALDKGLYSDIHSSKPSQREYSTLRARKRKPQIEDTPSTGGSEGHVTNSYVIWYAQMLERGLRRILYWLGDEEAMSRSFEEEERGTSISMTLRDQRSSKRKQL